jgi:N-acetylglucosamine-6-phosphate deacetylase
LPSLITSNFEDAQQALQIVKEWVEKYGFSRGVVGIHLEGPFISTLKKGIHCQHLIQETSRSKLESIVSFAKFYPILKTIAPEKCSED